MTISIVGLIVAFIIICLAFWVIRMVTVSFQTPAQVTAVAYIVLVVIVVLWLLSFISGSGVPAIRWR